LKQIYTRIIWLDIQKVQEPKNRDWNYDKSGLLDLRGDDAQQSKQKELKAERQRDYNSYISQVQCLE